MSLAHRLLFRNANGRCVPFLGLWKKLEKFRAQLTNRQASREKYHHIFNVEFQNTLFSFHFWINEFILSAVLLPMLQRAGGRAYSNFKAVTLNGESPYEELAKLTEMIVYKKSFFKGVGRASIVLALFWWYQLHVKLDQRATRGQVYSQVSTRFHKMFTRVS